jgi:hypothetical protein
MLFTQYDYMVETLAPDRTNQPLVIAVLPQRHWVDGPVPDTAGAQSPSYNCAADAMPEPTAEISKDSKDRKDGIFSAHSPDEG